MFLEKNIKLVQLYFQHLDVLIVTIPHKFQLLNFSLKLLVSLLAVHLVQGHRFSDHKSLLLVIEKLDWLVADWPLLLLDESLVHNVHVLTIGAVDQEVLLVEIHVLLLLHEYLVDLFLPRLLSAHYFLPLFFV